MTTPIDAFLTLQLGSRAEIATVLGPSQVAAFAELTNDRNPIHLDEAFAKTTRFGGCIAHGMLVGSLLSAVLATKLPGPGTVYMQQSLRFRAPVRVGATVVAAVEVVEVIAEKRRVRLVTTCSVDGAVVVDGEALVMLPA